MVLEIAFQRVGGRSANRYPSAFICWEKERTASRGGGLAKPYVVQGKIPMGAFNRREKHTKFRLCLDDEVQDVHRVTGKTLWPQQTVTGTRIERERVGPWEMTMRAAGPGDQSLSLNGSITGRWPRHLPTSRPYVLSYLHATELVIFSLF